jgi:S-adenosylmethionine:tRNA ribosyltransferase-isomerase
MYLSDFDYPLPEELIAQYPLVERSASRLLCLDKESGALQHHHFFELAKFLRSGDLLVFNDTRVIPARVFARKSTGGKVEVLLERILSPQVFLAQLGANKPLKIGTLLVLGEDVANPKATLEITGRQNDFFILTLQSGDSKVLDLLHHFGQIPLPPYIQRHVEKSDLERYQTIFAKQEGAVAAPTAGLHFDTALLERLSAHGIDMAFLTLHVGAGTFQPVRVENLNEHKMHSEEVVVTEELCAKIAATKRAGGRVIAVGTTVVRSLETAARNGRLQPFSGTTDIFIRQGFEFRCVDGIITNFHLPKSTLLMLIAAFAGYENVMQAYREAIKEHYRFFSYGDAMFIA